MDNTTAPGPSPDTATAAGSNGVPGQPTNGAVADSSRQQAFQRAEDLVDRWAAQVGHCASSIGNGVLKWFARAREEAEDIWAEAQAIAQQKRSADQSRKVP